MCFERAVPCHAMPCHDMTRHDVLKKHLYQMGSWHNKNGCLRWSTCCCLLLQVDGLYLMMGRGLDRLQQVPAGNVIAIGGLGTAILKSATITSSPACRPLAPMLFQVTHPVIHSSKSIRLSIHLSVRSSICPSVCPSVLLSIYPYIHSSVHSSIFYEVHFPTFAK